MREDACVRTCQPDDIFGEAEDFQYIADVEINRRSILAMRCIGQGLESLKTFCAVMSLPNPVEHKSHDVINNKLSRVMKEVAEESMKMAAVKEYSSSPDNLSTVSGDGTWKTR
ncbi:hypothetical protein TNCV_1765781 [Trichonephila clavipes]|nr:hypothetical protein TNCV_1765781 [Trichonephila clavipes]